MPITAVQFQINQHLAQRRLAPAPVDNRCTSKKNNTKSFSHSPYPHTPLPASVARRNARERNRVKQVNNGFAALRQHIPTSVASALGGSKVASRKLSKVDTLRLAVEYIKSLKRLLDDDEGCSDSQSSIAMEGPNTPPESVTSHSPAPSLLSDSSLSATCQDSYEAYENYEPMSPEDEELLDVISWWQQQ